MSSIPVVDLRDFTHGTPGERERFVKTFGDGLREFGFVTVDRHEVPLELTKEVFAQAEKLFALSADTKRRYIVPNSGGARGYTEFGKERAVGASVSDLKEFWHVGQENPQGPLADLYPRNVWPNEPGFDTFRDVMLTVYRSLEECSLQLLRAVAVYLELPEEHFARMAVNGNSVLRVIHYPPVPPDAPPNAVRAAAHEDINLITLLCEASSGGLELKTRDGSWMPVSSLDGQIVADAGDMLQLATNAVIPSTTHRVVNPTGPNVARYSMPFFVHPAPDVLLQPAPTTVGPDNPPKFEPITANDYLMQRVRDIGLYEADAKTKVS